jgi:hypothetical protein
MKIPQMTMAPKRNKESSVYLKDLHSLAPTEGSSYTGSFFRLYKKKEELLSYRAS